MKAEYTGHRTMINLLSRKKLAERRNTQHILSKIDEVKKNDGCIGIIGTQLTQHLKEMNQNLSEDSSKKMDLSGNLVYQLQNIFSLLHDALSQLASKDELSSMIHGVTFLESINTSLQEIKTQEVKEVSDSKSLVVLESVKEGIASLTKAVEKKPEYPKITEVTGKVSITALPAVKVENMKDYGSYFTSLEKKVGELLSVLKEKEKTSPSSSSGTDSTLIRTLTKQFSILEKALVDLKKVQKEDIKQNPDRTDELLESLSKIDSTMSSLVEFEVNKPTLVTPPVTNISINALNGTFLTTAVSVGTSATALPTSPFANRRSLIVFNNSANTIYIGNSDVTTTSGLPVLKDSYSPEFNAGSGMNLYGIASTGTNNVRVIEISNAQKGM